MDPGPVVTDATTIAIGTGRDLQWPRRRDMTLVHTTIATPERARSPAAKVAANPLESLRSNYALGIEPFVNLLKFDMALFGEGIFIS